MGLFEELKRRNVFRAAIAYLVVAWLVLQVATVVFDIIGSPQWVSQAVLAILVLGFPVALLFAWLYELTPSGLRRDDKVRDSERDNSKNRRTFDRVIIVLLGIAVVVLLLDEFLLDRRETAPTPIDTSIAVLPFDNRSADTNDAFFVQGVHDDVLTQLGKVAMLQVISRTSVQAVADADLTIPEIGKLLGAATILEGAVQRAGDRVRISVQLVDAARDQQIWSEQYDRELSAINVFDIQSEIATRVASAMRATLTSDEAGRINTRPTESIEAYEAFLLGRSRLDINTIAGIRDAREYFEKAVGVDPDFALAHVGLADAALQEFIFLEGQNPDLLDEAGQLVDHALELQADLAEAYAIRADIRHVTDDFEGAEADVTRALALNPGLTRGRTRGAELLFHHLGQQEAGIDDIKAVIATDPLAAGPRRMLASFYLFQRQHDKVRETLLALREIYPDDAETTAWLSINEGFANGDFVKVVRWQLDATRLDPENPTYPAWAGATLIGVGLMDEGAAWLEWALQLGPDHYEPNDVAMYWQLYEGDQERAIAFARRSVELQPRYASAIPLSVLTGYDLIQGMPEQAIARYREAYPELLVENPVVTMFNYRPAIDVAYLLHLTGDEDKAQQLFAGINDAIRDLPVKGGFGLFLFEARLRAAEGDVPAAIVALKRAYDGGVFGLWRYARDHDYILDVVREAPEFEEVADLFDQRVAEYREQLQAEVATGLDLSPP